MAKSPDSPDGSKSSPPEKANKKSSRGKKTPAISDPSSDQADAPDTPPDTSPDASPSTSNEKVMRAGVQTGIASFLFTVVGLAVLIGIAYATAPFWIASIKPYLPAALKDPFEDPRIVQVAKRVNAIERLTKAQEMDAAAISKLEEERTRFSKQLSELMQRLDAQDRALKSMQKMIQATAPPSAAKDANKSIKRLSDQLSYLGKNAEALDQMLKRIARLENDEQEISRITKRLNSLEKLGPRAITTVTGASATVLAVNQLRDALRRPTAFAKELAMVKRLAGGNKQMLEAIDLLAPFADKGVPTLTILRVQFKKTAREIVRMDQSNQEADWVDRLINRLRGLVTIRRLDGVNGESTDALVLQAEEKLEASDLAAAVAVLEKLKDKPAEAAQNWLRNARTRLITERALATLHVQAVALLAPAKKQ